MTGGRSGPSSVRTAVPSTQAPAEPIGDPTVREILITVSPRQVDALARDLRLLREHGAESNTQAIIEAVHEYAARANVGVVHRRNAA
jgi:hypothetical protein